MDFEKITRKSVRGITPYSPGKSIESLKDELGLTEIIKLASNENPYGSALSSMNVLEEDLSGRYPEIPRAPLLSKLAKHLGVDDGTVILGNGSDEVITMLGLAFLNPNEEILTADCTFSEYDFVAKLMDAKTIKVPLKDNRFDLDQMGQSITTQTRMVFLANPNNPTGTYVTESEFSAFLKQVPETCLVILDEAYFEYVTATDYPNGIALMKQYPNLVILRTFSKIYGLAPFRIGYGIAAPQLISILHKVRQPFNINSFALKAAEMALDNVDHVKKSVLSNIKGKAYLTGELSEMGVVVTPSEANFLFVDLPISATNCFQELLKKGLIIRDMTGFGRPNSIRVTVGTESENEMFIQALKTILAPPLN
ncbi:histidinol-phosphate transaminase [bacterium]|jgi:histidinol-phosphate aminotransferase|nr:histidinol-phosphate transaminase [bacterium]